MYYIDWEWYNYRIIQCDVNNDIITRKHVATNLISMIKFNKGRIQSKKKNCFGLQKLFGNLHTEY